MDLLRVFLKNATDAELVTSDQSGYIIIFNIIVIVIKEVLNRSWLYYEYI